MLAVRYTRFGPAAEVAELADLAAPETPRDGEALIDVEAAPINPADLLRLEGRYGNNVAALPGYGGAEGVGRVRAIGHGVENVSVGDRVLLHQYFVKTGTWRQQILTAAQTLIALPEADPLQLSMLTVNPATAWLMLSEFVDLQPGDWVVQNAGNSAVGRWLLKLAAIRGLRLINVVRRESAVSDLRAAGAAHVLVDGADLPANIRDLTANALPRLAIDAVGGEATEHLAASLAEGGVVVNYGLLSGQACQVAVHDTVFRDVSLRGFWLQRWWKVTPQYEIRALYQKLAKFVADSDLSVPIKATYPITRVGEALKHAALPERTGKVLITMESQ